MLIATTITRPVWSKILSSPSAKTLHPINDHACRPDKSTIVSGKRQNSGQHPYKNRPETFRAPHNSLRCRHGTPRGISAAVRPHHNLRSTFSGTSDRKRFPSFRIDLLRKIHNPVLGGYRYDHNRNQSRNVAAIFTHGISSSSRCLYRWTSCRQKKKSGNERHIRDNHQCPVSARSFRSTSLPRRPSTFVFCSAAAEHSRHPHSQSCRDHKICRGAIFLKSAVIPAPISACSFAAMVEKRACYPALAMDTKKAR